MFNIEFYSDANGHSKVWELRPGNNRVLYFFHKDNSYVLLSIFIKETQKTPSREIEKAKAMRDDWLTRKES